MTTPLSNRPKVTQDDIVNGYVTRYFVRNTSTRVVTEIDKTQYQSFRKNPLYQTLTLQWEILGYANNSTGKDGRAIYGTRHKNLVTIDFYDKQMPGLKRILRNPLEYFFGVFNNENPYIESGVRTAGTIQIEAPPTTTTTTAPTPPTPLIITVYDLVASTFEPLSIYNASTGMDGIIENVEPMNIVVNQPFFYTPA
jgi:hypothetical protein